jgi:hypothetical protein
MYDFVHALGSPAGTAALGAAPCAECSSETHTPPHLVCFALSPAALQVSSLELKTNLLAAYVSAGLSAQLPELMRQLGIKPRDSFEIAFNRSAKAAGSAGGACCRPAQ